MKKELLCIESAPVRGASDQVTDHITSGRRYEIDSGCRRSHRYIVRVGGTLHYAERKHFAQEYIP